MLTNKTWWRAALTRAVKTVAQTLGANLIVGGVSAAALQGLNIETLYVILAWLGTGLLAGLGSLLWSLAGLPEVEMEEQSKNEQKQAEPEPEIRIVRVDGEDYDEFYEPEQEGRIVFLNNEE